MEIKKCPKRKPLRVRKSTIRKGMYFGCCPCCFRHGTYGKDEADVIKKWNKEVAD